MNEQQNMVLELAVVEMTSTPEARTAHARAIENLASFEGFVRGVPLVGLGRETLHADAILWESAHAAHAAAESIRTDERFAPFMSQIASVTHFSHYVGVSESALAALASAPVIELMCYARTDDAHDALRARVHAALAEVPGALSPIAAVAHEGDGLADLIGWTDAGAHRDAPQALLSRHPDLAPFFEAMGKPEVFELFEVLT